MPTRSTIFKVMPNQVSQRLASALPSYPLSANSRARRLVKGMRRKKEVVHRRDVRDVARMHG